MTQRLANRLHRTALIASVLTALAACGGGDTSGPTRAELRVVAGAGQSAHLGAPLPMPVVVRVQDPGTGTLSGIHLRPHLMSGGTVSPSEAVTDANGEATFVWTLAESAGTQQLVVEDVSATLRVTVTATAVAAPGPSVAQLAITTQPEGAVAGYFLTTQPVIELRDSSGARVAGSTAFITASISNGFVLSGATSVRAVDGVARFSNLWVSVAAGDSATLTFSSLGVPVATSAAFVVAPPELQLMTQQSPGGANDGATFATQPIVRVALTDGLVAFNSAAPVTVSIASGTGTLSGTTTVSAVAGVATFADLGITGTGPHTLSYSSPGIAGTTSPVFVVGPPLQHYGLNIGDTTPMSVRAGQTITIPIVLDLSNAHGGDVASISFTVTWDVSKFSFVSRTGNASSGLTIFDNTTNVATGTIVVAGFAVPTMTTSRTIYTIVLAANTGTGGSSTPVTAVVSAAADGSATRVTITPRNLLVNITP